jgi:hypothetical protein
LLLAADAFAPAAGLLHGGPHAFSRVNVAWCATHHACVGCAALLLTGTVGISVDRSWGAVALGVHLDAMIGLTLAGALTGGHLEGFEERAELH